MGCSSSARAEIAISEQRLIIILEPTLQRKNQEIKINIRIRIDNGNHRTWDRDLPKILFGMRRRQNAATGQTPSHLLLGWTLPKPGDSRNSRNKVLKYGRSERNEPGTIKQSEYMNDDIPARPRCCSSIPVNKCTLPDISSPKRGTISTPVSPHDEPVHTPSWRE